MRGLTFAVAVSLVFVLSIYGYCESPKLKIGDKLPGISLSDLNGKKVSIPDDFSGKILVLYFWTSWCPSCEKNLPAIEALIARYSKKGISAVFINFGEGKKMIEGVIKRLNIYSPVLLDPYVGAATNYSVRGVPSTMIVDRNGIIRYRILGETSTDALEGFILNLLK
ncbi:MAG: TlpA disulfide reductase family protein [Thermodesulfovibrionales bacterium]|nr:TlpA disulfide reductase family protein [Thermodesulfovibrionales bacterium]